MSTLQILAILATFGVLVLMSTGRRGLAVVVIVGFMLRCGLAVYDNQGETGLPWSGYDSISFHGEMQDFLKGSMSRVFWEVPIGSSEMFPWVMSWVARGLGDEYLFMVFLIVLLGTYNIIQIRRIGDEFLQERFSRLLSWILCLYPISAVLSSVFLRETVIATFILAAFYYLVLVIKHGKAKHVAIGSLMVLGAAMFHGAMIIWIVLFPLSYMAANWITFGKTERTASPYLILLLTAMCVVGIVAFGPRLSKIGDLSTLPERINARAQREAMRRVARDADYPVALSQNIYRPDVALARYSYFLFAPFPWACRGMADAAGSLIGIANFLAILLILYGIVTKRMTVIPTTLFFMFILTTLAFSTGVNNVGTGIRHRNKAMPALICAVVAAVEMRRRKTESHYPRPAPGYPPVPPGTDPHRPGYPDRHGYPVR